MERLGGWAALSDMVGEHTVYLRKPEALTPCLRTLKRAALNDRTAHVARDLAEAIGAGDEERGRNLRGILLGLAARAEALDRQQSATAGTLQEPVKVWLDALNGIEGDLKKRDGARGLRFGIPSLDSALAPGLRAGRLCIIGAGTSEGKTVMALQMALATVRAGLGVLYASFEMLPEELLERAVSMETSLPAWRVQQRRFSRTDPAESLAVLTSWAPPPGLLIVMAAGLKAERIPGLVQDARRQLGFEHPLSLVVVDHLQLVRSGGRVESRALELKAIADTCKALALDGAGDGPLAVLALSQLNRNRDRDKPDLANLKESGSLEEGADLVLLLARGRDPEGHLTDFAKVRIAKYRAGRAGVTVPLTFDPDRLLFR
jgi:replicative DNA helicase